MQQTELQAIWLDVDGMRIHCLTAGESGTPVVLLHGAGADSATLSWSEVIGPLSTHHRIFAPDLPGYGQSERPDIHYTMDFYVSFHLPFLDELSWWLIGRSRSLVRWSLLAGIIYNPARLSEELVDRVYQAVREPGAGKAYISFQRSEVLWSGLRSNFISRLHKIMVPTLLVYGAEDTAIPLAYIQRAHTLIPNSQLSIMQECRHWPQGEKPEAFTRLVGNFLDV